MRMRSGGGFLLVILLLALVAPRQAVAHPADRLKQDLLVQLSPEAAEVRIALSGGILANERVLVDLDRDGDKAVSDAEARAWKADFLDDLRVSLDGEAVPLSVDGATLTVPAVEAFHLGLGPLVVAFRVALPTGAPAVNQTHQLTVRNGYLLDRTDFRVAVGADPGTEVTSEPLPSRSARIGFKVDPGSPGRAARASESSAAWGASGLIEKAKRTLERPKTPALVCSLILVFLVMGALHALQPGHGKALVAAYLVATGGTARDAMTLAGIVTFTHTISVFVLGLATLAASQVFLPSRVIPVLGIVSGALVIGMGAFMLRGAVRRHRLRGASPAHLHQRHVHAHVHAQGQRAHAHDHAALSDDAHTRLHLADVQRAVDGPPGSARSGVSSRNLLTLGVSGGLAPCPDALAILLLAVGINQFALGMLAILAFSIGLAGVLVGFGLAVALAGPLWTRFGRIDRGHRFGRLVTLSPVLSGAVVLLLGVAMVWRASTGF